MEENNEKNLFYLDELSDYKVASDYPDVRGWEVQDVNKRTIGTVDGLLVSKKEERVVYLDVEVNESVIEEGHEVYSQPASSGVHEFLNKEGENHLILPIGLVDLDEDNKIVFTNDVDRSTFARTKRFNRDNGIDRTYELTIYAHYFPESAVGNTESTDNFYNRPAFNRRR